MTLFGFSRAQTSSHIEDALPSNILANYPPIFVLPTRLALEELHKLEDELTTLGATLTYDVSEARIFLGTITQRKRAALELRARGIWTEEVSLLPSETTHRSRSRLGAGVESFGDIPSSWSHTQSPSPKRRRLGSPERSQTQTQSQQQNIADARSTESGNAPATGENDNANCATVSPGHAGAGSNTIVLVGHVKVIKLEWLIQTIKARKPLDINNFVVYHGKVIARPKSDCIASVVTSTKTTKDRATTKTVSKNSQDILARAVSDATAPSASRRHPPALYIPPTTRRGEQQKPPTLYSQSTSSEEDQAHFIPPAPEWVRDHIMYSCMRSAPLHPPNEEFIEQLIKIRKIRELTLDEIGVRAYSTSIAAIAAYPYEIRSPVEILSLPGCDAKIANLFVEFRNSSIAIDKDDSIIGNSSSNNEDGTRIRKGGGGGGGARARKRATIAAAESLDTDPVLRTIHQFSNIWGVGAKKAREFYYQRHWRDLDDVIEHGWSLLSRVQQIGLKYYDEFLAGVPRGDVTDIANIVHRHARLVRPGSDYDGRGVECIIVGGYRRGKEIQGDIDIILTHRDERITKNLVVDVLGSLENERWVTHTLALHVASSNREQQTLPFHGEPGTHRFDSLDKALVVWQDPHFDNVAVEKEEKARNPNPHRRVDIIISPWRTVGCAVLGWSGDTTFERDLRRYAKKKHGWKFDSSGVREQTTGGSVIDLEGSGGTWEERERLVMEGLGVGWRPASERCTR